MALALMLAEGPLAASAAEPQMTAEQQAEIAKYKSILDSLHPRIGDVGIGAAKATLHLGREYYFLPAAEAQRVLTEGWGNPPDSVDNVLGMVFPTGKTFVDDTWAAVITFDGAGFVSDEQATPAEYDALVKEIQDGEPARNAKLKEEGYRTSHLVGWAQPPSYDKATHTLIWARDIQFGEEADHTLNYDLRTLGRHGVLSLNIVSSMSELPQVRASADKLRQTAAFDTGETFADFDPSKDKATGYGLLGLVGAGLGLAAAKKLGFLAVVLLFAKKGFVVIAAVAAGLFARFRKLFARKPRSAPLQAAAAPVDDAAAPADTSEA